MFDPPTHPPFDPPTPTSRTFPSMKATFTGDEAPGRDPRRLNLRAGVGVGGEGSELISCVWGQPRPLHCGVHCMSSLQRGPCHPIPLPQGTYSSARPPTQAAVLSRGCGGPSDGGAPWTSKGQARARHYAPDVPVLTRPSLHPQLSLAHALFIGPARARPYPAGWRQGTALEHPRVIALRPCPVDAASSC